MDIVTNETKCSLLSNLKLEAKLLTTFIIKHIYLNSNIET